MACQDPIDGEIRRFREEYAARFNHDLQAIFENLKKQQELSVLTYVDYSNGKNDDAERKALKKAS